VRAAAAFFSEKGVCALVWDNAPAHRANVVKEVGPALCYLPPFSPELNPAERVFEEVRRCAWKDGYGTACTTKWLRSRRSYRSWPPIRRACAG
jgi:transposase